MSKNRILVSFTADQLYKVFYEVKVAINKVVEQCGLDESKLRIAIPKYFTDILTSGYILRFEETPLFLSDDKLRFYGVEVIPNFDNFIVVFHEDMPLFIENFYVVVDLK